VPIARIIHITGHVQGVFFREWAIKVANHLCVNGWVRNRKDGSVEIYAVGEPDQLKEFASELRKGSPASRVDVVNIAPADLQRIDGFMRRATI
jgi:acylphosphatase